MSGRRYVLLCCLLLSAVGYALFGLSSTILILIAARIPAGEGIYRIVPNRRAWYLMVGAFTVLYLIEERGT